MKTRSEMSVQCCKVDLLDFVSSLVNSVSLAKKFGLFLAQGRLMFTSFPHLQESVSRPPNPIAFIIFSLDL